MYVSYPAALAVTYHLSSIFAVGVGYWCVSFSKTRSDVDVPNAGTCQFNLAHCRLVLT